MAATLGTCVTLVLGYTCSYLAIAIYGYGHLHTAIYLATATPGYS